LSALPVQTTGIRARTGVDDSQRWLERSGTSRQTLCYHAAVSRATNQGKPFARPRYWVHG
jgi:hypothetical protein